jgi:hypothetical protein
MFTLSRNEPSLFFLLDEPFAFFFFFDLAKRKNNTFCIYCILGVE